jgi:hypothetical protein
MEETTYASILSSFLRMVLIRNIIIHPDSPGMFEAQNKSGERMVGINAKLAKLAAVTGNRNANQQSQQQRHKKIQKIRNRRKRVTAAGASKKKGSVKPSIQATHNPSGGALGASQAKTNNKATKSGRGSLSHAKGLRKKQSTSASILKPHNAQNRVNKPSTRARVKALSSTKISGKRARKT